MHVGDNLEGEWTRKPPTFRSFSRCYHGVSIRLEEYGYAVTFLTNPLGACLQGELFPARLILLIIFMVAKNYRESEKVGFAQIPPGIDLYVCPRSDTIITILAKYGFFKGMAALEEDQDSLIGCVVWRRSQSSTNLASKTVAEGKKALVPEQPLKCSGQSVQAMNSPAMEKKVMPSEAEMKESSSDPPSSETAPSCSNSQIASFLHSSTTVQTTASSIPYSCPLVPSQQKTCEGSFLNLLQENMKLAGITPVTENSGEEKAVLVSESWTPVVVQSLGMFGSLPTPAPRPLIPYPNGKNPDPKEEFQLIFSLFLQGIINEKMLQTEIHTKHHTETTRSPSFPRIQINSGGSIDDIDNNDDDDLPEFDFNSACEEQPDAPMTKLTHFPDAAAPPLNKAFSFEAAKAESFEAFQHNRRAKTSPLAGKTSTSNEGFSFLHKFGDKISNKPPSTESFQFKKQATTTLVRNVRICGTTTKTCRNGARRTSTLRNSRRRRRVVLKMHCLRQREHRCGHLYQFVFPISEICSKHLGTDCSAHALPPTHAQVDSRRLPGLHWHLVARILSGLLPEKLNLTGDRRIMPPTTGGADADLNVGSHSFTFFDNNHGHGFLCI
ncbi:hypothetical protein KSP40_PGU015704 [Platanthera guangdongensis]|uniref:Uncharacterized protein n=1 Tax=Platanthera guangdongensis TaxID=2320717 RepID=A0ABR2LVR2_9ASPA